MCELSVDTLTWVERTVGGGVRIVGHDLLRAKPTQPTWLLRLSGERGPAAAVLKVSPPSWVAGVRGEAVALQLVEDLGVPAPRLLGVDVSGEFGSLLLLETVVPGTSTRLVGITPGADAGARRCCCAASYAEHAA